MKKHIITIILTFLLILTSCATDEITGAVVGVQQVQDGLVTSDPVRIQVKAPPQEGEYAFVRPSAVITQAEIDIVKDRIANNIEPQISAYNKLIEHADEYLNFETNPPLYIELLGANEDGVLAREGRKKLTDAAVAAYGSALAYTYSGNTDYADKAVEILNIWSRKRRLYKADDYDELDEDVWRGTFFSGRDRRLQVAKRLTQMVYAYDLLYDYPGWAVEDRERFKEWWYHKTYGFPVNTARTRTTTLVTSETNIGNHQCAGVFSVIATGLAFHDEELINLGVGKLHEYFEGNWKYRQYDHGVVDGTDYGIANYYYQDLNYGGTYKSGAAMGQMALTTNIQAVEVLRMGLGINFWEEATNPQGVTLKDLIIDHFRWNALGEPFYWWDIYGDGSEHNRNPDKAGPAYEIVNNHYDIPMIQNYLESADIRPVHRYRDGYHHLFYDTYSTLNRGDMPVLEMEPGFYGFESSTWEHD